MGHDSSYSAPKQQIIGKWASHVNTASRINGVWVQDPEQIIPYTNLVAALVAYAKSKANLKSALLKGEIHFYSVNLVDCNGEKNEVLYSEIETAEQPKETKQVSLEVF